MEKNKKEKISVIVPVYNAEKTLTRCVASLRNQIYSNIEIILVNDGSKDDSFILCKKFQEEDNRIIIINQANEGVSSARNAGLKIASGKYVMFCDSDDWVYADYCSYMLEHAEKKHLVMCGFEEITNEDTPKIDRKYTDEVEDIFKEDFLLYRELGIGSPWNKLFELEIINKNNIRFPENISLGEDLAFVMEYLKHMSRRIIYLHRKLYIYQNENAVTLSKKSPLVSENEIFFDLLSSGIRDLSGNSKKMLKLRDRIIMQDYEKSIIAIAAGSKRMLEKYQEIKKAMNTIPYQTCCEAGVGSGNRVYEWMFKKQRAGLLMGYFKLMNYRRK